MKKTKYLINNQPVKNLRAWCKERKLNHQTFTKAIYRAKKGVKNADETWKIPPSNECCCLGYFIIRLNKNKYEAN